MEDILVVLCGFLVLMTNLLCSLQKCILPKKKQADDVKKFVMNINYMLNKRNAFLSICECMFVKFIVSEIISGIV